MLRRDTSALAEVLNAASVEASYHLPRKEFASSRQRSQRLAWRPSGREQAAWSVALRQLFAAALAGTRSAASGIRHMLYRAEPYQIDIQIELPQEQDRLVITGQLVDLIIRRWLAATCR